MRLMSRRGVAVVLEVLAVMAAGSVLGFLIAGALGVPLRNPLSALVDQPDLPLLPLAGELATVLFWQYLGWGLCGGLLWLLRPRARGPAERAPWHAWAGPRRLGFVAVITALAVVPMVTLSQLQTVWQFGVRAPWFEILQQRPWDHSFWIFTAVGSFAVIPVVEELFYRGYVFGRLTQVARPLVAAALSAGLFAFSHAQYLQVDVFNIAMLAAVSYLGVVLALATAYSRSLVPAMIAHAVINLPMLPTVGAALVLVALLGLGLFWARWHTLRVWLVEQVRASGLGAGIVAAVAGALVAVVFHRVAAALAMAALPIWLGLVVWRAYHLWQARRATPTAGPSGAPPSHGA